MRHEQSKEQMMLELSQNSMRAYKRRRISPNLGPATRPEDQDLTQAAMEVEETTGYNFFLTYRKFCCMNTVFACIWMNMLVNFTSLFSTRSVNFNSLQTPRKVAGSIPDEVNF
jgi:hypothetical protein